MSANRGSVPDRTELGEEFEEILWGDVVAIEMLDYFLKLRCRHNKYLRFFTNKALFMVTGLVNAAIRGGVARRIDVTRATKTKRKKTRLGRNISRAIQNHPRLKA